MDCRFVSEPDPVIRLPGGRMICRLPHRLYATILSLAPDAIHFEGLVLPRLLHGLGAALPGIPIIAQDHGTKLRSGWRRWVARWGFAPLSGAMFTAREQAEPFKRAGVLRQNVTIYEVMEGSSDFTPGDRDAARAATGLSGDPCLLCLGNLDSNKDPLMVLEAVARASSTLPALQLYLCFRRAPLLDAVRARISGDPRLAARVRLLGEIPFPGTESYIRAADFVVQGSHAEGSGFAAIEAFACGTTPLMTDIPSLRRIAGDGQYGALVPAGDAPSLERAIIEWSARDRSLLRREAREHFEHALSFAAVGKELRAAYQGVSGRR